MVPVRKIWLSFIAFVLFLTGLVAVPASAQRGERPVPERDDRRVEGRGWPEYVDAVNLRIVDAYANGGRSGALGELAAIRRELIFLQSFVP